MDFEVETDSVDVDTTKFINEIKKYQCIWNYKSDSYSNRIVRYNSWEAIAKKFAPNFSAANITETAEISLKLQKKWKHLRDGFNRYVGKCKKNGGSSISHQNRKYAFFTRLKFLLPLCEDRPVKVVTSQMRKKRQAKLTASTEADIIKKLSKQFDDKINDTTQKNIEVQDDDKLFLISLNSDFKKIPDEYKLDAKSEIIAVIKKYKTFGQSTPQFVTYQPYHHQEERYCDEFYVDGAVEVSPLFQKDMFEDSLSCASGSSEDVKPVHLGMQEHI